MKTHYSLKSPKQSWDTIVIGSGMGGMVAAALLAQTGQKVLILEQHYVPGGFTHTFRRDHWEWDVGVHAIGEVTEHSQLGRLLAGLTENRLKWASLGEVYEQFFFPEGFRLDFPDHPRKFRDNLLQAFPGEAKAIDAYLAETKKVALGMRRYFLSRSLPKAVGSLFDRIFDCTHHFRKTSKQVLDGITSNERLKTVLAAQWGYHGATPSRSSFAIQALVTRHFAYGGFYPVGGASQIARELLRTVAEHGGWTRVRAPVRAITIHDDKAIGVSLQNGESIIARQVISAIGAHETIEKLLPNLNLPNGYGEWKTSLSGLGPSPCHICLYIGFEGDIRSAGATGANQWFWESWDVEKGTWDFMNDEGPPAVLYTSYPSLKNPAHDVGNPYHTGEAVTFVPYAAFRRFVGTRTQKRGEEYERMKRQIEQRILEQLLRYMPGLRDKVRYVELSTPLTTEYYTRSYAGAIYGLEPTPQRFANPWLRPRTPVRNLFLSGTDVGTAGVMGAMAGGILAAVAVSPLQALNFMRKANANKGETVTAAEPEVQPNFGS